MFPALNYKTEWISVTTKQKILIMVSKEEQIELLVFQENKGHKYQKRSFLQMLRPVIDEGKKHQRYKGYTKRFFIKDQTELKH